MAGALRRWVGHFGRMLLFFALVLVGLAGLAALDDLRLPRRSRVVDRIETPEKARLAEALHLHQALGDSIWPTWGAFETPLIVYNERFAFLVGMQDPPAGWQRVPGLEARGGAWQLVPGDSFAGAPYYRQPLPAADQSPEAFTVRLGGRWAASLPTLEWLSIGLVERLRGELPPAFAAVFPFRLAVRVFTGGSAGYVAMLEHETFHAFQGARAPEALAAAERATRFEEVYGRAEPSMREDWRGELELLHQAAVAPTGSETRALAARFLAARRVRRARAGLAPDLMDYERRREWLEGLAKYVEVESWRRAATTPGYRPAAALKGDPGFRGYGGYVRRRNQELTQLQWAKGEPRFYYTGLAEAVLLDRLLPGWKARALADSTWLEDLLEEGVSRR